VSIELDGEYLLPIAGREIPTTEGGLVSIPDSVPWILARGDHVGWIDADGSMRVGVVKTCQGGIELMELERLGEVPGIGDEGEKA
jgi:hypothetical protein